MSSINDAVDSYLRSNLDRYIEKTSALCAQPSVSATGEGTDECGLLVAGLLRDSGYDVSVHETPGNPIVVGHMGGESDRTLLFYNHYDVQPPEPLELWTTPPYEPTVRDGALYARGAKDDKGEFVSRLAAVDAVRAAHGGQLPCGVTFILEGEEEVGSPHIAQFVRDHTDLLACDASIWEEGGIDNDGRPVIVCGLRGVLAVGLSVRTMVRDAHSGGAHMLPSAAWRLVHALESLKGADERIRIAGFYDDAKKPTDFDLQLLEDLPLHEDVMREQLGIDEFLLGRSGNALKRAVFEPTCNIQGLASGYQGKGLKTIVPAEAMAKIDFRLVPDQDPEDIFGKLCKHLVENGFEDVKAERIGMMWPAQAPPDHPFVTLTGRTGAEIYGKAAQVIPLIGASSPVYAFAMPLGGIPIVSAGVGYWDNRTHAPDEHVRLVDFLNAARHIGRILNEFSNLW